ncbi:hypothetical protein NQZ68_008105 [Dissostichus eleginoides]|nr:hypothetical protein NQZ68_008105 [Dissostichus eleginoides]
MKGRASDAKEALRRLDHRQYELVCCLTESSSGRSSCRAGAATERRRSPRHAHRAGCASSCNTLQANPLTHSGLGYNDKGPV